MKRFFVNKYPITNLLDENGKLIKIGIGTIFTIVGIVGDFFELKPIKKIPNYKYPILIGPAMLNAGFTEHDDV